MPITAETRENGHVRYYVITDPWKTNDLIAHYPEDREYRDSVDFTVHMLMNISQMKHIPTGLLAARTDAPAFSHRRSGYLVMIGAGGFARVMAETIFKLAHYDRALFFDNEDQGWDYIRKVIAEEPVLA